MELDLRSRVAEKIEEQSGSVLLTYFHGDINSMVDEHFTRALSKATKPKGERPKTKRNGKSAQSNDSRQWETMSQKGFHPIFSSDRLQGGTHSNLPPNPHVSLNHPPNSPLIWSGGCGPDVSRGLPPVVYPSAVSTEGLVVPEQQYTNSLVNLLHNDRPELSSVVVSSSKHDLISGWTKYPGFGNQMSSDVSLDSGVQVIEKKNLYWY